MADIITGPGKYLAEWNGKRFEVEVVRPGSVSGWVLDAIGGWSYSCHANGEPFADGPRIISRIDEPEAQPGPANEPEPEWKPGDECVPYHKDGDAGPFPPYWLIGIMSDGRFVTEDRDGDLATWPRIERPAKRLEWTGTIGRESSRTAHIGLYCDADIDDAELARLRDVAVAAVKAAEAK